MLSSHLLPDHGLIQIFSPQRNASHHRTTCSLRSDCQICMYQKKKKKRKKGGREEREKCEKEFTLAKHTGGNFDDECIYLDCIWNMHMMQLRHCGIPTEIHT